MKPQEWYEQTHCSQEEYSSQDVIETLKDPGYRMPGWVPQWDEAEFKRAQMELTVELRKNGMKLEGFFNSEDPRLDQHWRDDDWDDVLVDQWWRYVVKQYHKSLAQQLIDKGLLERVDIPRQTLH